MAGPLEPALNCNGMGWGRGSGANGTTSCFLGGGDELDSAHADVAEDVLLPGREGDGYPLLLPKVATLSRVIPGREGDGCPLLLS